MHVTMEKKHFLNEEQKKIKQLIMESLFKSFKILEENESVFDNELVPDVIISCIIMFTRDSILKFLAATDFSSSFVIKEKVSNTIIDAIKKEITEKLNENR